MMHDFLVNNHFELTRRCREKVARRPGRSATDRQLENGVPMFLDQLIRTLRLEQGDTPLDGLKVSGPSNGGTALSEVRISAAQHGRDLLELGFSVDEVVHDYGDLCQSITDLAFERDAPFLVDEFRTLNRCLDNAIADAVTEFGYQRDIDIAAKYNADANERLGFFVHEIRNYLNTATMGFDAARIGNLNLNGATGSIIDRSLKSLALLINRSLDDVKMMNFSQQQTMVFSLSEFIGELAAAGHLAAKVRGSVLTVSAVDQRLAVHGNRHLLFSAVWNLLQNAFKYTAPNSEVIFNAYGVGDRIMIDVEDRCGGLSEGSEETMFVEFTQHDQDKTGLGVGLPIAKRCVEENHGTLKVTNLQGTGCIFTVDLPRYDL